MISLVEIPLPTSIILKSHTSSITEPSGTGFSSSSSVVDCRGIDTLNIV